jgi:hypothetical protein
MHPRRPREEIESIIKELDKTYENVFVSPDSNPEVDLSAKFKGLRLCADLQELVNKYKSELPENIALPANLRGLSPDKSTVTRDKLIDLLLTDLQRKFSSSIATPIRQEVHALVNNPKDRKEIIDIKMDKVYSQINRVNTVIASAPNNPTINHLKDTISEFKKRVDDFFKKFQAENKQQKSLQQKNTWFFDQNRAKNSNIKDPTLMQPGAHRNKEVQERLTKIDEVSKPQAGAKNENNTLISQEEDRPKSSPSSRRK